MGMTERDLLDEIADIVTYYRVHGPAHRSADGQKSFLTPLQLPQKLTSYVADSRGQSTSAAAKMFQMSSKTLKSIMNGGPLSENMLFRLRNSLEYARSECLDYEQSRYQAMRSCRYQYPAWRRSRLEPRGDIWRIAENVGLLACAGANHYWAGIDTNSCGEFWTCGVIVELRDGFQNRQTGAHCTLAVIIMGFWPTEIGHHAIAKILGDISTESSDGLSRGAMIARHPLPPLFWVELRGNFG